MFKLLSGYIPFVLIPVIMWGTTRFLKKKNQYSSIKKVTLYIGVVAFFLTEMARSFYRPWIYKNHLFDYYISDTIGNSFGTVTAIFMILTISGKGNKKDWIIISVVVLGLIGYELLNLISDHPMDYRDIIATLIFGGLSAILYHFLLRKYH